MAETLVMLALSPTMESGKISHWSKKEGDTIESGDVLCEVETDKTSMDYETVNDGTLLKQLVAEGAEVKVGAPIAIVGEEGEDISVLIKETSEAETTPAKQSPVEEPAENPIESKQPEPEQPRTPPEGEPHQHTFASPLARTLAKEAGLDIARITGTGPGARVVKKDIEQAMAAGTGRASGGAPRTDVPTTADDQRVPVSDKRKVIAQRLSGSFFSAPHYFIRSAVTMDSLVNSRKNTNAARSENLSLNAYIMKFVSEALRRHPMVNASWDGDAIVKHNRIDIALAVAQADGLITPIVRNCERKGIEQIDIDLKQLIAKAREGKLAPEEYTGGTFTISNLGSYGIREFTAIINPPEAAILAVGEIVKQPVVGDDDSLSIVRQVMLTLSADHRILDGVESAKFLKTLREMIEDPGKALL